MAKPTNTSEPAQAFDSPEAAVAAAYVEYADAIQRAVAQMTDYQSLPPSVLAKPSVNPSRSRKSTLTLASRLHLPMARSRMTWPP